MTKVTHKDKGICVLKSNLQPLYSSHFCTRAYWLQLSGVLRGDVTGPFLYLATASELCRSIPHAGIALEAEAGFNFSMTATSGVCQASARGRRSTNRRRINDQPQLPRDQKRAKSCSAHGQQGNVQSAAGGGDPRRSACYNCASLAWSLWVGELAEAPLHSTGRPKRRASGRLQGSQRNFKKRGK